MKYECYKLFVKRKAWLLLLVFTALRLLTAFLQTNYASDYRMELYRDAYFRHMEVLEGRLTEEKAAYIEAENALIRELTGENSEDFIGCYIRGEITEDEFNERYRLRTTGYERKDAFAVINDRYRSVSQNPERVYFLYSNGWTGLFGNEHLDFVLLILVMLLTVPMICDEFSTGMYPLLRTAPNGGARLYAAKAGTAVLTAMLSAMLFFAAEAGFYAAVLGLPDGSFPLQSLPPFEQSPYPVSILGAAALTLLNRFIGVTFLTLALLCLSALTKRALSAVFLGTAGILLPYILFAKSSLKYLLPTPLGFLLSSGWLKGSFPVSPNAQEILTVTPAQYRTVLLVSAGLTAGLFLLGMLAFTGFSLPRIRRKGAAALCLLCLLLTGCGKAPASEPDLTGLVYDKWQYRPESEAFSVIRDEETGSFLSYPDSGGQVPLIHDCFTDTADFRRGSLPYIDGDTVYYVNQYSMFHMEIIALDTRDFSERCVYRAYWSDNLDRPEMLFGLGMYLPSKKPQEERTDAYFVHHGQLVLSKPQGIFRIDLRTGDECCIHAGKTENLAATCGYLYYLDELLDLYRCDLKTNVSEKLPVGKIRHFYAAADGLYCRSLKEDAYYFVPPDGSQKEPVPDFDGDAFLKGELT